jgi:hypothetical protein
MRSCRALAARDEARLVWLTFYYVGIVLALLALYGTGSFVTRPFVYQGF